jgi:hypothetical protein
MRLLFLWHCTVAVTVLWGGTKHRMGPSRSILYVEE